MDKGLGIHYFQKNDISGQLTYFEEKLYIALGLRQVLKKNNALKKIET